MDAATRDELALDETIRVRGLLPASLRTVCSLRLLAGSHLHSVDSAHKLPWSRRVSQRGRLDRRTRTLPRLVRSARLLSLESCSALSDSRVVQPDAAISACCLGPVGRRGGAGRIAASVSRLVGGIACLASLARLSSQIRILLWTPATRCASSTGLARIISRIQLRCFHPCFSCSPASEALSPVRRLDSRRPDEPYPSPRARHPRLARRPRSEPSGSRRALSRRNSRDAHRAAHRQRAPQSRSNLLCRHAQRRRVRGSGRD